MTPTKWNQKIKEHVHLKIKKGGRKEEDPGTSSKGSYDEVWTYEERETEGGKRRSKSLSVGATKTYKPYLIATSQRRAMPP